MRGSKGNAPGGVCGRVSWKLARLLGGPDWASENAPKDRLRVRRRQLRIEPLETRCLMDASGLASLVSPTWFQSESNVTGPAHAGAATWTAQDTIISTSSQTTTQGPQSNLYDWIVQYNTAALAGITSVAETTNLLAGGGIQFQTMCGLGMAGEVLVRSSGASFTTVENWLAHDTHVATFEEDAVRQFQMTPNDPATSQLWNMTQIKAQSAWNISTGSHSVVVAEIDTGVDYTDSDLAANIWTNPHAGADGFVGDVHGYDFANNDGNPMDDNGHGTHVAGTIGAVGNNGQGVAGVDWAVSIMPLKFLDSQGTGYLSDAIRAINYVTMERTRYGVNVRVINNSWGGGSYSAAMQSAIQAAGDAGILFVVAAGNSGTNNDVTPQYPANYSCSNIISVAASDQSNHLASFSCYGATTVDIAAPGVSIYSTLPGNRYATYSGTSMATPLVSGVAALCWAIDPTATVDQVRDAILGGADKMAALNGKVASGGVLDAYNTLELLEGQMQKGPAIGSFTASPTSVNAGSVVTLSVHGATASTSPLHGVSFFRDVNNNGIYDAGDITVGTTTTIVGGQASIQVTTAGMTAGTYHYLARVEDNTGHWSTAAVASLTLLAADDYGNTAAAAAAIAVPSSMSGTLGVKGDVDWFKFQATAGGKYTVATVLGTLPDSILYLYDRNGTAVLASNDDYGSSLASRIQWTAPSTGTYYIVVASYGNSYTGSYTLSMQAQNVGPATVGSRMILEPSSQANGIAALAASTAYSEAVAATETVPAISLPHAVVNTHDFAPQEATLIGPRWTPTVETSAAPLAEMSLPSGDEQTPAENMLAFGAIEQNVVDEIFSQLGDIA